MKVADRMITKCLIGNTGLVCSGTHEKSSRFKGFLIAISMHESACIGIYTQEKCCSSLRSHCPIQCPCDVCEDDRGRSSGRVSVSFYTVFLGFMMIYSDNLSRGIVRWIKCCTGKCRSIHEYHEFCLGRNF